MKIAKYFPGVTPPDPASRAEERTARERGEREWKEREGGEGGRRKKE